MRTPGKIIINEVDKKSKDKDLHRYSIILCDGTVETVFAYNAHIYTADNGEISRVSFYDEDDELKTCYSGKCVWKYYREY